jgi:predicted AAA+ superfamily ATPase
MNNFDLNSIKKNPLILIIGKPGTGKSSLVKTISNFLNIDKQIIFSKNKNEYTSELSYRLPTFYTLKEDQKKLIIIDNYLSDDDMNDQEFTEVLLEGRYYDTTFIITMNYLLNMRYEILNNFDYVFLLSDNNINDIKTLYECFGGMFYDFDSFHEKFKKTTKNYNAMVISNYGPRNRVKDSIFKFKNEKDFVDEGWISENDDNKISLTSKKMVIDMAENERLIIKKFNLREIKKCSHILIIGKRGSGKSELVKRIYENFKNKVKNSIVICPTEKFNNDYKKLNNFIIHDCYNNNIMESIIDNQSERIKNNDQSEIFICLDDCLNSKIDLMKDPLTRELLLNGRNYNITYVLTLQYILGTSPELINNFDYIFLLADDIIDNQKKIYKYYAGMFPNFKSFQTCFYEVTKNHGAMVLENSTNSKRIFKLSGIEKKRFEIETPNAESLNKITDEFLNDMPELELIDSPIQQVKNKIEFKNFNFDTIKSVPSIVIIGKRGTGKTTLVKNIYDQFSDKARDFIVICSNRGDLNHKSNAEYYKKLDKFKIFKKYSDDLIENILSEQKERKNKNDNSKVFLVLDDCLTDKGDWPKSQIFFELVFNSRVYNIILIITTQYASNISPAHRENLDYVFLLTDDVINNHRKLYKYYGEIFPNFKLFTDTFREMTIDNGKMVIVNTGVRNGITDSVFRCLGKK